MSAVRPTVSAELLAALVDSTPDRVRRRLDKAPDAAATWNWKSHASGWTVEAGGETVTLPLEHVATIEQISCTCLLSPRCFHALACLTRLDVSVVETSPAQPKEGVEPDVDTVDEMVEPNPRQRSAARELANGVVQSLRVGIANAGLVLQAGLLRAVHQCRAEGLHRLAALGLRVVAGVGEYRRRAPESDPAQLAEDLADALETSHELLRQQAVSSVWIGNARRRQVPVRPRRLHGLFAEPIITRSGFAGAAVYFLGEDERIYSASDVRAGDAQHARDAYLGGIEIGGLIQPARQLARGLYLGSDMTSSLDGRLGRGKRIKIADQGVSTWQAEEIQKRFRRPLVDQWNDVYAQAALPADGRPAGWDFVFLAGTVLGAAGAELIFQPATYPPPIYLAIENESSALFFRENLCMLSFAPGLTLQVVGRVNLAEPRVVSALAIAQPEGAPNDTAARLEIPRLWAGRICLGFDEIQRSQLVNTHSAPVVLSTRSPHIQQDNSLDALRRRWIGAMLAGSTSRSSAQANIIAAEISALRRQGFSTGAALVDALSKGTSDGAAAGGNTFLAAAIYLRSCRYELARAKITLES